MIYCIVPESLALELHDMLRQHYRDMPGVEVVIERRQVERRTIAERRAADTLDERRDACRREAERRAALVSVGPPSKLPPEAAAYRGWLRFFRAEDADDLATEDRGSAALVVRFQRGDEDAFSALYLRYFDRIYAYMRVVLTDNHSAEDATQQVFIKLYEALPRYEDRGHPFRAFLFVVARNHAVSELRRRQRLDPVDPVEIDRHREPLEDTAVSNLPWVSDRELLNLIERLPLAQRQVLVLRFMLDLTHAQIGQILERNPEDVRALLYRALGFMRTRLKAMGRGEDSVVQRMPMCRRAPAAPVARARRAALSR
jgi:RNA polymerase sigma-70 factor (ECF subfamily)